MSDDAKTQARAKVSAAESAADTAAELAELAATPMAALNAPTEDVLGRPLPEDPDDAVAQQREAHYIRDQRVAVDTARVQRGLPTKYADK